MTPLIYLASPYTGTPVQIGRRFKAICRVAAHLIRAGHHIWSPVIHCHPIAQNGLPADWKFWQAYDENCLSRCDELWIVTMPGWSTSAGIAGEKFYAYGVGKPVRFVEPHPPYLITDEEPTPTPPHISG